MMQQSYSPWGESSTLRSLLIAPNVSMPEWFEFCNPPHAAARDRVRLVGAYHEGRMLAAQRKTEVLTGTEVLARLTNAVLGT